MTSSWKLPTIEVGAGVLVIMKKGIILITAIFFFIGLVLILPLQIKAQYGCSDFCSGSNSCNTCGGCVACSDGCNGGTGLCNPTPTPTNVPGCQPLGALCGSGCCAPNVCSGGICTAPTATPTFTPTPTTPPTRTISGTVYIDTNGNGFQDGGESGYTLGATVSVWGQPPTVNTNGAGFYSKSGLPINTYTVELIPVPSGYKTTTTNPVGGVDLSLGDRTVNFGIQLIPPPTCPGGISANPLVVGAGSSSTISVSGCTDLDPTPTPPGQTFTWNPDPGGTCPGSTITGQTDTPSSSTANWNAPNCPASTLTCRPQVIVVGGNGTTTYGGPGNPPVITVPAAYTLTAKVLSVTDLSSCPPPPGGSSPVGGVSIETKEVPWSPGKYDNVKDTGAGGTYDFSCLPSSKDYTVSLGTPAGYKITGTNGGSSVAGNVVTINSLSANGTITFCIAPINPWFQTDKGDVRFYALNNPVPIGQKGSTDPVYPGIYYASHGNVQLGNGTISDKSWAVNSEYDFNADTQNRNGGMSYDFYKAKIKQQGVAVNNTLIAGALEWGRITQSGVYEVDGNVDITSSPTTLWDPSNVTPNRVVLLVKGDVTISAPVTIPTGKGLFIVAASGNITVDKAVGVATPNLTTSNLDGYYSAQGSIILDGDTCSAGVSDNRLNVGGALIANALKPFAASGMGKIQNLRSICADSVNYPSLFVASRPDFLVQMTDFYKTEYTKWQEVNP